MLGVRANWSPDMTTMDKINGLTGPNEKEVLFRPNAQFEVVGIDKSNNFITITLNEVKKNGTS